ncbi:MAG: cytochrome c3 family protein [Pirellulaceae bacterium]
MPQLFSRSSDTIFRAVFIGLLVVVCGVVGTMFALARSSYLTGKDITVEQPIPFSHRHHVADIGIDCRYCHRGVETSAHAGIPSSQICMNCHRKLWNHSEMLKPVRVSYREDKPIAWNRVHDLADYVYFNHSIHIAKGIGCYECHGRIDQMPLTRQAHTLTMGWCLECHRSPIEHVRPTEFIFVPQPLSELVGGNEDLEALQHELAESYHLRRKTDCYTCHR